MDKDRIIGGRRDTILFCLEEYINMDTLTIKLLNRLLNTVSKN